MKTVLTFHLVGGPLFAPSLEAEVPTIAEAATLWLTREASFGLWGDGMADDDVAVHDDDMNDYLTVGEVQPYIDYLASCEDNLVDAFGPSFWRFHGAPAHVLDATWTPA